MQRGSRSRWLVVTLAACCVAALADRARGQRLQPPRGQQSPAGLRMWHFPHRGADRFELAVWIGAGARDEDPRKAGLAELLRRALFASAGSRPAARDDPELRARGIEWGGATTHDATVVHVAGPRSEWRLLVDWLADHVLRPRLLDGEVDLVRRDLLDELAGGDASAARPFADLLYRGHELGRPAIGSRRSLAAVTVDDLRAFHAARYALPAVQVGFAGAVPRGECFAAVAAAFAGLPQRAAPDAGAPPQPVVLDGAVRHGARGGRLVAGFHLLPGAGLPADVTELVRLSALASYLQQRFVTEVQQVRPLCDDASVALHRHRDVQRLEFGARFADGRNAARVLAVVDELLDELVAPDATVVDLARNVQLARFEVGHPQQLVAALRLTAELAALGSAPQEFLAAARGLDADGIARAAAALDPALGYRIRGVPLAQPRSLAWPAAVAVTFPALLLLLALWLGRGRRSRARGPRRPAGGGRDVIRPVDAELLEQELQRWFEEQDRSRES